MQGSHKKTKTITNSCSKFYLTVSENQIQNRKWRTGAIWNIPYYLKIVQWALAIDVVLAIHIQGSVHENVLSIVYSLSHFLEYWEQRPLYQESDSRSRKNESSRWLSLVCVSALSPLQYFDADIRASGRASALWNFSAPAIYKDSFWGDVAQAAVTRRQLNKTWR